MAGDQGVTEPMTEDEKTHNARLEALNETRFWFEKNHIPGSVTFAQFGAFYRFDFDESEDATEMLRSVSEDIERIGYILTQPQVEHDCITGIVFHRETRDAVERAECIQAEAVHSEQKKEMALRQEVDRLRTENARLLEMVPDCMVTDNAISTEPRSLFEPAQEALDEKWAANFGPKAPEIAYPEDDDL